MPLSQVPPETNVGRQDLPPCRSLCSWTLGAPDTAWVRPVGEFDLATTPELAGALSQSQLRAELVVLDLREVAFMDSSAVHAIIDANLRARHADHRLVVLRSAQTSDRVMTLTGAFDDIEIGDLRVLEPPAPVRLQLGDFDWDRAS
jgi:anti-sigma B factor antagonist